MRQQNTQLLIAGYLFAMYNLIEIMNFHTAILMALYIIGIRFSKIYYKPINIVLNKQITYCIVLLSKLLVNRGFNTLRLLTKKKYKTQIAFIGIAITLVLIPFMLVLKICDPPFQYNKTTSWK